VQKAVHRVQPAEQVFALDGGGAREIGFESVNVDLIYGLPLQTPESFRRTLEQVASCAPTASRSMPTRTCRALQAAAPHHRGRAARAQPTSWRCCRTRSTC
jgi:hypothetical protein